jgi:aspartate racemase
LAGRIVTKHIGLVGGIGPAATDYYYRRLIARFAERGAELQLTIAHADAPTLIGNLTRDDSQAQVAIFARLTDRLAAAGATSVAITSIAGHFCIEAFKLVSQLPVIDLLEAVSRAVEIIGYRKLGILGTQTVMETCFFGGIASAELFAPAGDDRLSVHRAYVAMAASGRVTEEQRRLFYAAGRRLIDAHGVEAIMLGGTDLVLAFDGDGSPFETIDCAGIHADAIAAAAI